MQFIARTTLCGAAVLLGSTAHAQIASQEVADFIKDATGVDINAAPHVNYHDGSRERWRRGSATPPAAYGQIDEFTYQLRKEDLVRWDNPNIKVPVHIEWIKDYPNPIDKRQFRNIDPFARFDRGHIYVAFKPGTTYAAQFATFDQSGTPVKWTSEFVPNLHQVKLEGKDVVETVNHYLDMPEVLYAEPCYIMQEEAVPNDTFWGDLWGLGASETGSTNCVFAWDDGGGWTGDPNFVVAVIDTGTQINCADINANQWVNPSPTPGSPYFGNDLFGWNVYDNNGDVLPCGSAHGTHVAGTIGAVGNNGQGVCGVNWQCKLMILKCNGPGVCGDPPVSNPCCGLSNTPIALEYAYTRGARVSNNSYGSSNYSTTAYNQILASQATGHIFVASAGNGGEDGVGDDNDVLAHYPDGYDLSNIISVAAINESAHKASFSNFGWNTVDVAAPGVNITSVVPPCTIEFDWGGTSMAAPHVSGAVALVWGKYPDTEWWKIKDRVCAGTYNPFVACSYQAQLNVVSAMGYWVGPQGVLPVGTYTNPFFPADFADAVDATPWNGVLKLRDGTSATNAPQIISKAMEIRAEGPATITR